MGNREVKHTGYCNKCGKKNIVPSWATCIECDNKNKKISKATGKEKVKKVKWGCGTMSPHIEEKKKTEKKHVVEDRKRCKQCNKTMTRAFQLDKTSLYCNRYCEDVFIHNQLKK